MPVQVARADFDRRRWPAGFHAPGEGGAGTLDVVGVDELEQIAADALVGRVTEMLLRRQALVENRAELVGDRDDVERPFDQRPVEAVVVAPRPLAGLNARTGRAQFRKGVGGRRELVSRPGRYRRGVERRAGDSGQHRQVRPDLSYGTGRTESILVTIGPDNPLIQMTLSQYVGPESVDGPVVGDLI